MLITEVEYEKIIPGKQLQFPASPRYLLLLLKSGCRLQWENTAVNVKARQAFYCTPEHALQIVGTEQLLMLDYVEFALDEEETALFNALPISTLSAFPAANFADLSYHLKQIFTMFYSGDKYRAEKGDAFLRLLLYCTASGDEQPEDTSRIGQLQYRLRQLRRTISDNPNSLCTVAEAASFVQVSPSHFQMLYKQYFNSSYLNDLLHIRIRRACALLKTTDWTVAQIAESLGYEYETYFYRLFKQYTGLSPREYRKTNPFV